MIDIKPPDWYNGKEVEQYFIQLIIYSNSPEEAIEMYCNYTADEEEIQLAKEIILTHYYKTKKKEGWRLTPLGKELL